MIGSRNLSFRKIKSDNIYNFLEKGIEPGSNQNNPSIQTANKTVSDLLESAICCRNKMHNI